MRQKLETLRRRVAPSLAVLLDERGWLLYNLTRLLAGPISNQGLAGAARGVLQM